MAVMAAPPPILQFFNNAGAPNVEGSILTQVGGVNAATYQDSAGAIPLPNPIPLNSRGEVSNASGLSCQLFLTVGSVYTFTMFDANGNQMNQATYVAQPAYATPTQLSTLTTQLGTAGAGEGDNLIGAFLRNGTTASSVAGAFSEVWTYNNQAVNDLDQIETVVSALQANTAQTIATFGDSTMWGANPANLAVQVATPPYQQLQNFINTYMNNGACTVQNFAISGTTLAQMLAGTDGSGQTYAARLASTAALIAYCNHGVNDAFGPNATTIGVYRANLILFIQLTRLVGKTPILVTPHPCLTIGGFGSYARAVATARFARVMRQVAVQHGVQLVDNNMTLQQIIDMDSNVEGVNTNTPLNILADGVHGPQATYYITGNNLADALIGAQVPTITGPGQILSASQAAGQASNEVVNTSTTSRYGADISTGTVAPQTLSIAFKVDRPGIDISLLHPIYSGGCNNISVNLDGNNLTPTTYSQFIPGWASTDFVQDFETCFARNINPGMHLLILTSTTAAGSITYSGLKSRTYKKPIQMLGGTAVQSGRYREQLSPLIELQTGSGTSQIAIFETMPVERFLCTIDFEFTATLPINCGMCIGGYHGGNTSAPTAQQLIGIGLNASGFVTITEATGPAATYTTTVLGATNLSGGSHLYEVVIQPNNTLQVLVDGTSVGSMTLAQPYYGGWLGLYKNLAATDLVITNVNRIRVNVD